MSYKGVQYSYRKVSTFNQNNFQEKVNSQKKLLSQQGRKWYVLNQMLDLLHKFTLKDINELTNQTLKLGWQPVEPKQENQATIEQKTRNETRIILLWLVINLGFNSKSN